MLPIVLVLLVATSALAAPSYVNLNQVSQNSILGPRDNSLVARALNIFDGGDTSIYILNIIEALKDLASSPEGQIQAFGQAIAVLGEVSTGRPGDSCNAASYINAYASGNPGAIRAGLSSYIREVANNIDSIVRAVTNPEAAKFATGSRGGCPGEGRTYQFDAAWDKILASTSPSQSRIIDQEYCDAKRLYLASNARNNIVGAGLTASALPPTAQVFEYAAGPISNLMKTLGSGGSPASAAAQAKQALISAVSRVSL